MKTHRLLRGLSVLAIVLAGFVSGTASAGPAACQLQSLNQGTARLTRMTGTYLPGLSGDCLSTTTAAAKTMLDDPTLATSPQIEATSGAGISAAQAVFDDPSLHASPQLGLTGGAGSSTAKTRFDDPTLATPPQLAAPSGEGSSVGDETVPADELYRNPTYHYQE